MTVDIGNLRFERVLYDDEADVLYLSRGEEPEPAADAIATPEGHAVRYADNGEIVGITFVNAKWLFERDGELALFRVGADEIAAALA